MTKWMYEDDEEEVEEEEMKRQEKEDEEEPEILRMVEEAEKNDEPFIAETAEMEIEPETGTDDEDLEVRKKSRCQPWRDARPRFKYRKTHKSHKEEEMATPEKRKQTQRRRMVMAKSLSDKSGCKVADMSESLWAEVRRRIGSTTD